MKAVCARCHAPFTGRLDKRFCSAHCRSAAWAEARAVPADRRYVSLIKHGAARVGRKTAEYRIWCAMRERCHSPKHIEFKRYGARGIKVCERWDSFANFLMDMGPRPSTEHSLDRHPNQNGNYEPGNVRWATNEQQARNKATNRLLTLDGQTHCVAEWAEKLSLSVNTIRMRLRHGAKDVDALRPISSKNKQLEA